MAVSLPYLVSNKNVGLLFEKIASSAIPDAFSTRHLSDTLGIKAANDRSLIPLLRNLGFLDDSNRPTEEYRKLKNTATARKAVANGIRKAYATLFKANEAANALDTASLKGLIAQVAGTDDDLTGRIASTFNSLVKQADFSGTPPTIDDVQPPDRKPPLPNVPPPPPSGAAGAFHFNIQVHLPANGTEETYLNIFSAIRKVWG
jgi:hypothetical protein